MKQRQIILRNAGQTALLSAYNAAEELRAAGFAATAGEVNSAAGSWANTVYILTDAPTPDARKALKKQNQEIKPSAFFR